MVLNLVTDLAISMQYAYSHVFGLIDSIFIMFFLLRMEINVDQSAQNVNLSYADAFFFFSF